MQDMPSSFSASVYKGPHMPLLQGATAVQTYNTVRAAKQTPIQNVSCLVSKHCGVHNSARAESSCAFADIQKHFTRSELPPVQKKLLRLPNAPPILPPIAEGLPPPQNMPAIGSAFPRTAGWQTVWGDQSLVVSTSAVQRLESLSHCACPRTLCT